MEEQISPGMEQDILVNTHDEICIGKKMLAMWKYETSSVSAKVVDEIDTME